MYYNGYDGKTGLSYDEVMILRDGMAAMGRTIDKLRDEAAAARGGKRPAEVMAAREERPQKKTFKVAVGMDGLRTLNP